MAFSKVSPSEIRYRVAGRLADYQVPKGPGSIGTLSVGLERGVLRAFKAHWTGFKLAFPRPTMVLTATLDNGDYWSEGYISIHQPSWILAFRKEPHKARGSGGPRPDDKLVDESAVERSLEVRRALITAGHLPHEELIRMEDIDDPLEAVDHFFNYTNWYVLRAIEASWDQLGYVPDHTIGWGDEEDRIAALPPRPLEVGRTRAVQTTSNTVILPPPPETGEVLMPVRRKRRRKLKDAAAPTTAPARKAPGPAEVRRHLATRLADYQVAKGEGGLGTLGIGLESNLVRTFKAHWTGFKLSFPGGTMFLTASLNSGDYWSEGYISIHQPSWVLAFRREPHKARGTGGPRPDDKLVQDTAIEASLAHRHGLIEAGTLPHEELIRMEDFDDPLEAIDEFFNYTTWYVLRAIDASWDQLGYRPDPSIGWTEEDDKAAVRQAPPALEEGLKASDLIWLTPDTTGVAIQCSLFVYRPGHIYVASADNQQIPDARNVREAQVAVRWKGRDARMVDFPATARAIGPEEGLNFELLVRQIVTERRVSTPTIEETVHRWLTQGLVLELTPKS